MLHFPLSDLDSDKYVQRNRTYDQEEYHSQKNILMQVYDLELAWHGKLGSFSPLKCYKMGEENTRRIAQTIEGISSALRKLRKYLCSSTASVNC